MGGGRRIGGSATDGLLGGGGRPDVGEEGGKTVKAGTTEPGLAGLGSLLERVTG